MPQLPTPLRAALGLVATAVEQARTLPDKAIEMPMLVVSTALQVSLRAQQHYAHLAARGDQLLNRREASDEPPEWATFDAPIPIEKLGLVAEPSGDAPKVPRTTVRSPRNAKPSAFDAIGDE